MSDPVRAQDFYRPEFEVKLDGSPLRGERLHAIAGLRMRDELEAFDVFSIELHNWDAARRAFPLSDGDDWLPGKTVQIAMGYRGAKGGLKTMIAGEIESLTPVFPARGTPKLIVRGRNALAKFTYKHASRVFEEQSDQDIAKTIAGEAGVSLDARLEGEAMKQLLRVNCNDLVFLMERARRQGGELCVDTRGEDPAKLYLGPSKLLGAAPLTLTYGRDLTEFQPTLDATAQVEKVTVRGWHPYDKQSIEATVERGQATVRLGELHGATAKLSKSVKGREEVLVDLPVASMEEARRVATGVMDRILKRCLTGQGRCLGLPEIRAGRALDLQGLGARYSGRYLVTASEHVIGEDGYQTRFTCRREEG